MEKTIQELVELALKRDSLAQDELYERTYRHAFYLAIQVLKKEDAALDVVQDSYIRAFTHLDQLKDPSKFQSWLNQIVVNTSKNYLKRQNKVTLFSQLESEDQPNIDFEDTRETFSPEANVDYSETKRLIQEMIDQLPEKQRVPILLYYMEDYSVGQIAEVMECSENTVKSRLAYGRKNIEGQVRELEKKGTKLYCVPLIPFLLWMFHEDTFAMGFGSYIQKEEIKKKVLQSGKSAVKPGKAVVQSGKSVVEKAVLTKGLATAAAVVCVTGGAVAITSQMTANREVANNSVLESIMENGEGLGIEEKPVVEKSEESVDFVFNESLDLLYQALESQDDEEVLSLLDENFEDYFEITKPEYSYYKPNQTLAIRNFSRVSSLGDVDYLFGLLGDFVTEISVSSETETSNFTENKPDGTMRGFVFVRYSWTSNRFLTISEIPYEKGVYSGDVLLYEYMTHDGIHEKIANAEGQYDGSDPVGLFTITLDHDYWDGCLFDENLDFVDFATDEDVIVHVEGEDIQRVKHAEIDLNTSDNYAVDETGTYYLDKRDAWDILDGDQIPFWKTSSESEQTSQSYPEYERLMQEMEEETWETLALDLGENFSYFHTQILASVTPYRYETAEDGRNLIEAPETDSDSQIIFNGSTIMKEPDGKCLVLGAGNWIDSKERESLTLNGFLGNFAEKNPDGEAVGFMVTYRPWNTVRRYEINLSKMIYENGLIAGNSEAQTWYYGEDGVFFSSSCSGFYNVWIEDGVWTGWDTAEGECVITLEKSRWTSDLFDANYEPINSDSALLTFTVNPMDFGNYIVDTETDDVIMLPDISQFDYYWFDSTGTYCLKKGGLAVGEICSSDIVAFWNDIGSWIEESP